MTDFDGFGSDALAILARFPDMSRDQFADQKKIYEAEIATPAKDFVATLADALITDISPGLIGEPKTNGSIAPINNDTRFSKGAALYKDNVLLRFWEGSPKKLAPTLFVRLAPSGAGFASGIMLDKGGIDRWRERVASDAGADLAKALTALTKKTKADVVGQELKKVPAPYDADHPRGDLLRHKMLQVRWEVPMPASFTKAAFVPFCVKQLKLAAPVHAWLVEHIGDGA